jgi:tartrate dehydrogenase/decarboxylase / D-malate dehydrogenase
MFTIACIGGDGVGPDVIVESKKVLAAIEATDPEVRFSIRDFPWGTDYYKATGTMMPDDGLETLSTFDAILFGAVGSPDVDDQITLRDLLIKIRFGFDQYVNLRPVTLLPGVASPLAGVRPQDIDMVFVREGTEGEYSGVGDRLYPGTPRELALQTSVFSRIGIERVMLWDDVFHEIALEYPEIETRELLVDAAAMFMVRDPARFGVVVTSNLFGDILTDIGAAIVGGMGLAPSASLNPERRFPSTFEPIHGSAPDIAGKGIANPLGTISSCALMLDHLGAPKWGDAIRAAVAEVVASGDTARLTPDLGGAASTSAVGDAVVAALLAAR